MPALIVLPSKFLYAALERQLSLVRNLPLLGNFDLPLQEQDFADLRF